MAYEISEGAAAAAMLIPYKDLKTLDFNKKTKPTPTEKRKYDANIKAAMTLLYTNLGKDKIVGGAEKDAYRGWLNPKNNFGGKYNDKAWDARVSAIIHGYSSALAIKNWMVKHGESINLATADTVYLTGGAWDSKIGWLKVTVNNWADYNSSDLVIVRGSCFYGVSLKKKPTESSANPPMINKSIMELLKSVSNIEGQDSSNTKVLAIIKALNKNKSKFFGGLVVKATGAGKPLDGSSGGFIDSNDSTEAFYTLIKHPKDGKPFVRAIDLKGPASLVLANPPATTKKDKNTKEKYDAYIHYIEKVDKDGYIYCTDQKSKQGKESTLLTAVVNQSNGKKWYPVRELFGMDAGTVKVGNKKIKITESYKAESIWKMRKYVNTNLGSKKSFFKHILKILDDSDVATTIGNVLLSAVLKTEMNKAIAANQDPDKVFDDPLVRHCVGCHFGFSLVTAIGKFDKGKMSGSSAVTPGNVKEHPTIQAVVSMLAGKKNKKKWKIVEAMNPKKSGQTLQDFKRSEAIEKGNEPPAKLFFTIGITGKSSKFHPVLDLEVRYKGTFSPWPQFLGSMSPYFIDQILKKHDTVVMKDCGS